MPPYITVFFSPIKESPVAQTAIMAVLILTLLDVIFGLINAVLSKSFSSQVMREGIGHKCTSLGFILVADIVDGAVIGGLDLGFSAPVLVSVCSYLAIMEIASLLETFAKMNPELAESPVFKLLKSVHVVDGDEDK